MSFTFALPENPAIQSGHPDDRRDENIQVNDPLGNHLRRAELEERGRRSLRDLDPNLVTQDELFRSVSRRVVIQNHVCGVTHGLANGVPPAGWENQMAVMAQQIAGLTQQIQGMNTNMTQQFQGVTQQFQDVTQGVTQQFQGVNDRLTQHDLRLNQLVVAGNHSYGTLQQIQATVQQHTGLLANQGMLLTNYGQHLVEILAALGLHGDRLNGITGTLANHGASLDHITTTLGVHTQQVDSLQTLMLALDRNQRARNYNSMGVVWRPLVVEHPGPHAVGTLPPGHLLMRTDVHVLTMDQIDALEHQHNLPHGTFGGAAVELEFRRDAVMRFYTLG